MSASVTLDGLFAGSVQDLWPGKAPSAIAKSALTGADVTETGLEGDAQADLSVHGGPGKALHVYPAEHYAAWRKELGDNPRFGPGGFGENLSIIGWTEDDVCIGDVWAVGSARLQVSQGRQPCWKLAQHVGDKRMVKMVRKTGRTGWYLRVLETGRIVLGDIVYRMARPQPRVTVARTAAAIFDARTSEDEALALAAVPELDDTWRDVLLRRVEATR
ncbi:MAG: MOSC domain-containing protein [Pseudomonadota bacterium]